MTKRAILIGSIVVLAVLGLITAGVMAGIQRKSAPDTSTTANQPDTPEPQEVEEYGHEHDEPLIVRGVELTPEQINDTYVPLARDAAQAFITQSTDETPEARTARLQRHFTPNSTALTAPKPTVDKSQSPNITVNPIIIDSSWETTDTSIVVGISTHVITKSNIAPFEDVSSIYQAYDVTLVEYNGAYTPQSIVFSNRPVILR